ncbi:MAG TPA: response regulator [Gemmatimonadales bacterium]|jgi:CheY-like chemotaxis protein
MARILVIDDDNMILKSAHRLLERAGHEVWESSSPKTALNMLATIEDVDVVITDVYMPGMNGVELVRRLSDRKTCRHVVAMTGGGVLHTTGELLAQARIAGAERTLEKPFFPGELVAAVDDVMRRPVQSCLN